MSSEPQHAPEAPRTRKPAIERLRAGIWSDLGRIRSISRRRLMTILILLLIGIAAVYVVEPRIETSVGAPPDPSRAILTPFLISNGGFFPFREVHLQCVARAVEFEQIAGSQQPAIDNSELHVTNVMTPSLRPGQKIAVTCAKGLENEAGRLRHADLDLNVCLKPYPLIDYISLVHFRYVGERGPDGVLRWSDREPRRSSIPWMVIENESDKLECQWAE